MSCLTSTVVEQLDTPRQQAIPIRVRGVKGFFAMDFTFLKHHWWVRIGSDTGVSWRLPTDLLYGVNLRFVA